MCLIELAAALLVGFGIGRIHSITGFISKAYTWLKSL